MPEWLRLCPLACFHAVAAAQGQRGCRQIPQCVSDRLEAHVLAGYLDVSVTPNPTRNSATDGRGWSVMWCEVIAADAPGLLKEVPGFSV